MLDLLDVPVRDALATLFGAVPDRGTLTPLAGDASMRRYYRLEVPGHTPSSLVIMRLPADATRAEEATGGPAPTELPFLAMQRSLADKRVRVPKVLATDMVRGVVLLEDLGDETFEHRLSKCDRSEWPALYAQAIDVLADLHAKHTPVEAAHVLERRFERDVVRWELDHFREWGLEAIYGPLASSDRAELDRIFDAWTDLLARIPTGFVHRDYQSRNLMWAPSGELVVIDFQDAMIGPYVYDLVALLSDSYVSLDRDLVDGAIARYAKACGLELDAVRHHFAIVAVQRKLKDAGRFVFIDRVRKNAGFLRWYPQSLVYVGAALRALAGGRSDDVGRLAVELEALLTRTVPGFAGRCAIPAPSAK